MMSTSNLNNNGLITEQSINSDKTTIHQKNLLNEIACKIAKIGSWRLDLANMDVEWSDELFHIYELEIEEIADFNMLLSFMQQASQEIFKAAIKLKQPFDIELSITTKNGNYKKIRSLGQPVTVNNQIIAIEGAMQDVTNTHTTIHPAEQPKNILSSFFDVSPDIYFVLDFTGVICDYRASKNSLLYVEPEQFLGKKIADIVPPHVSELFETNLQQAIETKKMATYEYDLNVPSGLHHFECRISPLPGTRYCITIIRDITNQYIEQTALKENASRFRSILDKVPFPIFITRFRDGQLRYGNTRAKLQLQFNLEEEIDLPATELYKHHEDRKQFTEALQQYGYVNDMEFQMVNRLGEPFWALMSATLIEYEKETAILTAINDITARKKAEEAVKVSEEKYRLLTEYTSDVIWVLNLDQQRFTYISPSVEQLRGFTVEEAMAQTIEESLTPDSVQLVTKTLALGLSEFLQNSQQVQTYFTELQQPCKNGELIWVEVSTKLRLNQQNEVEVFGVSRNIEERKKMEQEVLFLSYHDQLTGLYNRRFFEEHMKQKNSERGLPFTLIIADVNGLKLTNDAFGHLAGDELLSTFAEILKTHCREDDVIARVGGDEFVILLPKTHEVEAEKIVKRIKKAISESNTGKIQLSVSFGWKTKYIEDQHFDVLFKQAEDFMYRNKLLESNSFKGKTVKVIANMLNEKYPNEKAHSKRVSKLCVDIGHALELHGEDLNELAVIGLLHDIGKIGISEQIINKTSALNEEELKEIKRHPEIGYQILRSVTEYAGLADAVLTHHERIDGKGYPKGLKGPMIPTMAKILAIAEAFDTMINPPSYLTAKSFDEALKELKSNAGTHFDVGITKVFIEKVLGKSWDLL